MPMGGATAPRPPPPGYATVRREKDKSIEEKKFAFVAFFFLPSRVFD